MNSSIELNHRIQISWYFTVQSVVHCLMYYRFTYIIMQWDNAKIGSETTIDYSIKAHARTNPPAQAHVKKEVHFVER